MSDITYARNGTKRAAAKQATATAVRAAHRRSPAGTPASFKEQYETQLSHSPRSCNPVGGPVWHAASMPCSEESVQACKSWALWHPSLFSHHITGHWMC